MAGRTSLFQTLWRRQGRPGALAVILGVVMGACGDSSTGPSATNTPPTIQSVFAGTPQVEAEQRLLLSATVIDAETSPAQLTYSWAASPASGTFIGSGAQVLWKAPSPTTDEYTITLTVVETYSSGSATKEHRVLSSLQVRYSDLIIRGLFNQFLTDFGNSDVGAAQCVRNFSDSSSCGKAAEFSDVQNNRREFDILSATFPISSVTLTNSTFGRVLASCTFRDRRKDNGLVQTVNGTCNVTTVYENPRWVLCTSTFDPPYTTTPGSLASPQTIYGAVPRFSHP